MCLRKQGESTALQLLERPTVPQQEKSFNEDAAGPFGTYIWRCLKAAERRTGKEIDIQDIAIKGDFEYSHLHGILKGRRGSPVAPRPNTVSKLVETLESLGVVVDASEAMRLANLMPDGWKMVRENTSSIRENTIQYKMDPDTARIVESYTNAKGPVKQMFELAASMVTDEDGNIISVADALSEADHDSTTHGKRAE